METIIVTGASSGFGEAIARRFLAEGYNVIAIARRKEKLMELSMDFPRKVHALAMDITDKYSVDECLDNIPEEFENIIALINNAGLSLDLAQPKITISVTGRLWLTQIYWPFYISPDVCWRFSR